MNQTKISWADSTWNPVHGCSKVSAGCDNCYAETLSLQKKFTATQPLKRIGVKTLQRMWIGENVETA